MGTSGSINLWRRRWVGAAAALPWVGLRAQAGWQPTRPVEFVVPAGPGASVDSWVRMAKEILERRQLVPTPIIVSNRPGGANTIAINTVNASGNDGHALTTFTHSMLHYKLMGEARSTWADLTPVAMMFEEGTMIVVRADSPLRDTRDLVRRLRADPTSVSIGIATAVGNHVHAAIAKPLMVAGVDIARLTMVPFKSSTESVTAVLGGHIDAAIASSSNLVSPKASGRARVLAAMSGTRLSAPFDDVPTWREQGVDTEYSSTQGVLGHRGMTPEQVAFWAGAFRAVSETEEWKQFLVKQHLKPRFLPGAEMLRFMQSEEVGARTLLTELKLIKG
ncbi:MAG: Bug family tripartite tricarboxylate transporter substrate binding protein [Burkholderiaceae bacterium]